MNQENKNLPFFILLMVVHVVLIRCPALFCLFDSHNTWLTMMLMVWYCTNTVLQTLATLRCVDFWELKPTHLKFAEIKKHSLDLKSVVLQFGWFVLSTSIIVGCAGLSAPTSYTTVLQAGCNTSGSIQEYHWHVGRKIRLFFYICLILLICQLLG